jgi:hypothetical protein
MPVTEIKAAGKAYSGTSKLEESHKERGERETG